MSGSGISWAICKSAPRSRQITAPAPHHSVSISQCNTIRDAILTCTHKLQQLKSGKSGKLKSKKKRVCSEVSVNSPGNRWSQSWRRKGRLQWEGFAEKEGLSLEWKSEVVMDYESGNILFKITYVNFFNIRDLLPTGIYSVRLTWPIYLKN